MIIVLLLLTVLHHSFGHVALIFPPARKYDLDFLDSFRTSGACGGMPKGDIVTTIPNNQKINIEWHLGYAHKGGYSIEMINEEGQIEKDFTNGFVGTEEENKYTTNIEIDIPSDLEGKKIIRLRRHAKEWDTNYLFHSCADVEFVKLSVSTSNTELNLINIYRTRANKGRSQLVAAPLEFMIKNFFYLVFM